MTPTVHWTAPMLQRFKAEYAKHTKLGHSKFVFDGNVFLCSYAKYLIEYLETRL